MMPAGRRLPIEPLCVGLSGRYGCRLRRFGDEGVTSKFAVPERFVFAASLPKTSVGTVDKKQLRLAYGVAAPT